MDGAGGLFTAWRAAMALVPGRRGGGGWGDARIQDEGREAGPDELPNGMYASARRPAGDGRTPIGGDPANGYYNTTPPPGGEPPLSPSGHSYYTDEELAAWDAAGRPPNHNYLNQGGAGGAGGSGGWRSAISPWGR